MRRYRYHIMILTIFSCICGMVIAQVRHTRPAKMIPEWGYRFVITGDFNGDGKVDTLAEHYLNGHTKKEIPKFYDSLDYDQLVGLTASLQGTCIVTCSDTAIGRLFIDNSQVFGLSYLKNEGDLDGDGADEISYVVDYADWSAVNSCHLMTFKNGKWKEFLHFEIRDQMTPELPLIVRKKSMWGPFTGVDNNADNRTAKKNFDAFKGFIRKVGDNKISIHYIDVFAEPSDRHKIIDLHHIPSKFRK